MEKPSFHSLSASRGEFNQPPSSSTSGYEPCPDLIAMVRELSFSGLSSENPDHHLREFEQLCSRFASASMKQDVLRWMLFPLSLKGKAEQWYTSYTYTGKGSWDSLKKTFSIMFFQQNEKETLGATWARFSLLVKSDPTMSTLNPLVLWKFKRSLDKESADHLNSITEGVPLHMFPAEVNKILDYIAEYTSLSAESDPLQEECELTHEDLLAAEPNPSFPISSDSAVETSPEPKTLEGEEIHPPKFSSRFEDESMGNHRNTSNLIDAHSGKEPSSVHTDQSRDLLTEPSLRPTVPASPPDSRNEAPLEEAMKEDWLDGEKHFSEAIWISSPSTITPCSIRGTTVEAHINPIMEVNVLPWHLAYTLLGNVTLRPSDTLLKSCPSGHILECRGVASAVPLIIDKIEVVDTH